MNGFVVLTFIITLLSSTISGMSGGGGAFVTMPYFLFIGLTPAHALATSKLTGIGTSMGSITALKGKGLVHRKLVIPFMAITGVCAIVSAWLIPRLNPALFQRAIALVLIALAPTLFIKRAGFRPGARSKPWIIAGFGAYAAFSFLQTLVGTGLGAVLVLVLMFLFGLSALEANATKRVAQTVQSVILFVLLAIQGLVMWWHGVAGLAGSVVGSHIGTHIALKRGAGFIKIMLAVVMLTSGIALLI